MIVRKTQPKNNKYYIRKRSGGYSDAIAGYPTISGADVLCNCVGYAGSRFNEILGKNKQVYSLVCNAEDFIEAAKKQGLKISQKPVQGGILVWSKGKVGVNSDGAGHVAVVEEVYEDGSILTSESGYAAWAFKNVRRSNSNGNWGQGSAYKYRGCIVNPAVSGEVIPTPKLTVDGIAGPDTIRALQAFLGTPQDGVISGQRRDLAKYYPAIKSVTFGSGGSTCVRALQKWCSATVDGVWGQGTTKALQKKLGVTADGIAGSGTVKALQKFLNAQEDKSHTVIDVSEFQSTINWDKVKAAGVKGAIVRCGFRGAETGKLKQDAAFLDHIKGAAKAGLKVGIYMFTQAITADEAKAEADYAISQMKKAGVTLSYPIAVDVESVKNGRANGLSKAKRTEVVKAFCDRIKEKGCEPMIYASTSWLNNKLNMAKLPYKVWCAQYYEVCEYKGEYVMWQYTSSGKVNGVSGNVDMNHCYMEVK